MIDRRGFLAILAAPAIIRPGLLMSIKAAPEQFLICDGRAVSRTTYRELFAQIGTRYGGGDGMFNLPNLQSAFGPLGRKCFISTSFVASPRGPYAGIANGALLIGDGMPVI